MLEGSRGTEMGLPVCSWASLQRFSHGGWLWFLLAWRTRLSRLISQELIPKSQAPPKETRREHSPPPGLRGSGRGQEPCLPRPAQPCAWLPAPSPSTTASLLPAAPIAASHLLPPSRPAVPGCDHGGPTLTAVFLRPPLLMGRRDERSQASPLALSLFFFFLSCAREAFFPGAGRAGSTSGGSRPRCRCAPPPCRGARQETPGRRPPQRPGATGTSRRLPPGARLRSPGVTRWSFQSCHQHQHHNRPSRSRTFCPVYKRLETRLGGELAVAGYI